MHRARYPVNSLAPAARAGNLSASLLRDKTRPSRIAPLGPEVAERVVALTLTDPPAETTHWTADLMARARGISASAVRRI